MPKPGYKGFTFSLNPTAHKEFKIEAMRNGNTDMSDIIERFMNGYVELSQRNREKNIIVK